MTKSQPSSSKEFKQKAVQLLFLEVCLSPFGCYLSQAG
jgi:hypothetical protein